MNLKMQKYILELLETDSSRVIADLISNEVGDNSEYFKILFDFCLSKPYPVCMRAARALPFCVENHNFLMNPFLDVIVELTLNAKIEGVRRGFLSAISKLPDIVNLKDSGLLINQCYDWILSQKENPAIRIYSIDVIFGACKAEPLLKTELISVLEMVKDDNSAAVRSRSKKVLGKI